MLTTTQEVMAVLDGTFQISEKHIAPRVHTNGDGRGMRLPRTRIPWSKEDDKKLIELVEKEGMHWRRFTSVFDASDDAIRNRWKRITQPPPPESGNTCPPRASASSSQSRPRVMWTKKEDAQLEFAVRTNRMKELHLPKHPRCSWRNRIHRLGLDDLYRLCHKRSLSMR